MVILLVVVGWLACSVSSYLTMRLLHKRDFPDLQWTVLDRHFCLLISLCGPYALVSALVMAFIWPNSDKPARW